MEPQIYPPETLWETNKPLIFFKASLGLCKALKVFSERGSKAVGS